MHQMDFCLKFAGTKEMQIFVFHCTTTMALQVLYALRMNPITFFDLQLRLVADTNSSFSCTSPVGSMDSAILVESESGEVEDFTTLQVTYDIPSTTHDQ